MNDIVVAAWFDGTVNVWYDPGTESWRPTFPDEPFSCEDCPTEVLVEHDGMPTSRMGYHLEWCPVHNEAFWVPINPEQE